MIGRSSKTLPCAAAAALLSLAGSSATRAGESDERVTPISETVHVAQKNDGSPTFAELVRFVDTHGWRVNFGKLCAEFDLPRTDGGCVFTQVSVQEAEGRGDPRGFNVPRHGDAGAPYIFLYHLGPLVGEFFIVSAEGDLIKAFYRRKGAGYEPRPKSDVQEEFRTDLAYWLANLRRIRQELEEGPARRK